MRAIELAQDGERVTIHAGKKRKTMKGEEVDEYVAERGRRGWMLPQGFRSVRALEVERADEGQP